MENAGNTCYIDALMFAMFATSTVSDHLLVRECDESALHLQRQLRRAVRTIRRGGIVLMEDMGALRMAARRAGWEPQLYEQQSHEQVTATSRSTPLVPLAPRILSLPPHHHHRHHHTTTTTITTITTTITTTTITITITITTATITTPPKVNEHEHEDYDAFPQQDSAQFMSFILEQVCV
jgi:hypothetical protein